ncbi:MAG: UvrD-helicase domain-containing protein [Bacteroidia bacterium]
MAFTVYRAAAGSGKTYTLVREYLRLALGASQADGFKHILAITFTNKAAAEMKNRVLQALAEISGKQSGDRFAAMAAELSEQLALPAPALAERADQVLHSMLHSYQLLSIGTIDSFVARLARQFARELLLDQQFEIVLDQESILSHTTDRLLARIGEDQTVTTLLLGLAQELSRDDRSWQLRKPLMGYAKLLLRDEMRELLPRLQALDTDNFMAEREHLKKLQQDLKAQITGPALGLLQQIKAAGLSAEDFSNKMGGAYGNIVKWSKADFEIGKRIGDAIEKNVWYPKSLPPARKAMMDELSGLLNSECRKLLELIEKNAPSIRLLEAILSKQFAMASLALLQQEYEAWMTENLSAPLNSLYFRIADLLDDTGTPFIYERLGNRYRHFLIDEFQDTSILQWKNMLPLVENGLAGGYDSLLVGDAKQAIYRWRSGDANQFVALPAVDGRQSLLLQESYTAKSLKRNFRSYRQVIDFNNHFFHWLSHKSDDQRKRFYEGLEQEGGKKGGLVQVELLPKAGEDEERNDNRFKRIRQIVEEARAHEVPFGEMAVLVRSNKLGSQIAVDLLRAGFPVVSGESLLLCQQDHIRLCVACMHWLLDPADKLNNYLCLHLAAQLKRTAVAGSEQLQTFLEIHFGPLPLYKWRALPLSELGEHILAYFELLHHADPFVLRFVDLMAEKSQQFRTLAELLSWWYDKGLVASLQMPEQGDAIRVMTYHKAKGLEFGLVIVADPDNRNTQLSESEVWIETSLLSVGTALVPISKLKDAGPELQKVYEHEQLQSSIDYTNNLYVAFTRAVGALFILGSEDTRNTSNDSFSKIWKDFNYSWDQSQPMLFKSGKLPEFEKPANIAAESLHQHYWSDWRQRIGLQSRFSPDETNGSALSLGRAAHELLAQLPEANQLDEVAQHMLRRGEISIEQIDLLLPALRKLLARPGIAPWFVPGLELRNEISMLSPDGQQHRPDRLIIKGKQAYVLEFKTGEALARHQDQLSRYLNILELMGFEANGELVYFDLHG